MVTCYLNPAKWNAPEMLGAFVKGCPEAEITTDLTLRPGLAVLFGVDNTTVHLWRQIKATHHPFLYIDNGYFKARYDGGDYYRVTLNATQHSGVGESDGERWKRLGINMKPWRKDGGHILIALQSEDWYRRMWTTADLWKEMMVDRIRCFSDRRIVVRGKPMKDHKEPGLATHLFNSWAVVTHSSNVAVEGVIAGRPCVCTSDCAASVMGSSIETIESPRMPDDRIRWASVLADNQWRKSEIADGTAWRSLAEQLHA